MVDPFKYEGEKLIGISSGFVVPNDVEKEINSAYDNGVRCFERFQENRMKGNTEKVFDPIKKNKLKTFVDTFKPTKTSSTSDTVLLRASLEMVNCLLIVGQIRNVNLRELLSYSMTPVPLSLGTENGTLCKTDKSRLMHHLQEDKFLVNDMPPGLALIIDGMAFIQQMQNIPSTFGQLAKKILVDIMRLANKNGCSRIDFVCDCYPEVSIKNCDRVRRTSSSGSQVIQIAKWEQKTPRQYKKFLASGENKEHLIQFLFQHWCSTSADLLENFSIYFGHRGHCHLYKIVDDTVQVQEIGALSCDHEEADTRLLLHAHHTASNFNNVIIQSPDTDVMIISLAVSHKLECELLFVSGTGLSRKIINITKMAEEHGEEKCIAILGLHVFTGCDNVSAMKGKGKVKALDLLNKSHEYCKGFSSNGNAVEFA